MIVFLADEFLENIILSTKQYLYRLFNSTRPKSIESFFGDNSADINFVTKMSHFSSTGSYI